MFNHRFKYTFTWLRVLLVTVLVLGIFFRLVNLDRKVYWYDEGFTSLRVGGYTIPEVVQSFNGQVIGVADFRNQYLSPNSGRGFFGTIKSLAVEDPQHPPLYYLIAHLWMHLFGNSVAAIRSLPALISLLVFPTIYWLCLELFNSRLVGWISVAVIAVSPFHVLFAHEAREYSLWTVTILLSSAALLQAIRLKTVYSWAIYALSLILALYTFLFSALVAIAHVIYVIATEGRLSKTVIAYFQATFVAFVAFLPWNCVVIHNYGRLRDSTSWMTEAKIPLLQLARLWANQIKLIFFDFNKFERYLLIFILLLVGYSVYFVCRYTDKRVWLFLVSLFGVNALALILPDLIYGGQRSIMGRFLIPCYLSIQLAVSYLIARKISFNSVNEPQRRSGKSDRRFPPIRTLQERGNRGKEKGFISVLWQRLWLFVMLVIFTGGVISDIILSESEVPWTKLKNYNDLKIARTINQATSPLVVVSNYRSRDDPNVSYLFSFSHLLDVKVKLQLVKDKDIPDIPNGYSDVFLYNPCAQEGIEKEFQVLLSELDKKQNYKATPVKVSQPILLWRLTNKRSYIPFPSLKPQAPSP